MRYAIVQGAKVRGLQPGRAEAFEAINGLGVQADIEGKRVLVGTRDFLRQQGVDAQRWEASAETWRGEAKTVVFFAIDGAAAEIAAVADPIKENTAEAIASLRQQDIHIVMLTGDTARTADAIARQLETGHR